MTSMSSAPQGNLTILFRDETNSANFGVSQQVQTDAFSVSLTTVSGNNSITGVDPSIFSQLKIEEITEMQTTFATINTLLTNARPTSAKALISAIDVGSSTLITQELIGMVLEELAEA